MNVQWTLFDKKNYSKPTKKRKQDHYEFLYFWIVFSRNGVGKDNWTNHTTLYLSTIKPQGQIKQNTSDSHLVWQNSSFKCIPFSARCMI